MSVLLARWNNFHTDQLAATQSYDNKAMQAWLESLGNLLAETGLVAVEQNVATMNYLGLVVNRQASVLAFSDSFLFVAWFFLLTMLLTWFIKGKIGL